jgi:hypothetical protein
MESQNASFSSLSRPIESYLGPDERTILTGVYVVLSSLGLFANIFILSQAFADFGTAISLLIYIVHMYVWIWDIFYWYTAVVWLASLGTLFFLTFIRLLSVVDSFAYPRLMTSARAKALVVLNWILSLIVTVYPLLMPWPSLNTNLGRYYVVIITALVIMFNIYLFREARIQNKKIKRQNQIVTGLQVVIHV